MNLKIIAGIIILFVLTNNSSCSSIESSRDTGNEERIEVGAERMNLYLDSLRGKRVGLLVNHTSLVGQTHLLDTLLSLSINIDRVFTPEHGFRGTADAGEKVNDSIDARTGTRLFSLYGKNKKPSKESLTGLNIVVFDSQDVGARFFTYLSTMQLMMEACAESGVKMIILDRPNPNGHYVDGPVLDLENKSFVGMNPIPIVHGLSAGEYALMIKGEGWINNATDLDLEVIEVSGWDHSKKYSLTVKPSPNLPTDQSIALYPSICLFEGTIVSVGRGTHSPFEVIGFPDSTFGDFTFTPKSIEGMSKYPPYQDQQCYGLDLRNVETRNQIDLSYLIDFHSIYDGEKAFFNQYFAKLAGTDKLQKQIESGETEDEIRASWRPELEEFKSMRKTYLLYPDFDE